MIHTMLAIVAGIMASDRNNATFLMPSGSSGIPDGKHRSRRGTQGFFVRASKKRKQKLRAKKSKNRR